MSTDTILTPEEIGSIAVAQGCDPDLDDGALVVRLCRAIEQAVLQSEQVQELYGLLKESRQQLPLAAQFWNEDGEPDRGSRNVRHVMELIARVDAAMEKQP